MRGTEAILDRLAVLLLSGMQAQVQVLAQLDPQISLPEIRKVYINEYDYTQLDVVPAILLYAQEPGVMDSSGLLVFELPVDVVVWDIASGTGMEELHRRLERYRRGVVELLLGSYVVDAGFWEGLWVTEYLASPPMELAGRYGRAKGVRFTLQVSESYH